MSEFVYHRLELFPHDECAVAWLKEKLGNNVYDVVETPEGLSFDTPWEPQVCLVLEASREFPNFEFRLSFFGSCGTVLENSVKFTMKAGKITIFQCHPDETSPSYIPLAHRDYKSPTQVFFEVLEYCAKYEGGSCAFVRNAMAPLLDQGMSVADSHAKNVTRKSLETTELSPRKVWSGISPDDFAGMEIRSLPSRAMSPEAAAAIRQEIAEGSRVEKP